MAVHSSTPGITVSGSISNSLDSIAIADMGIDDNGGSKREKDTHLGERRTCSGQRERREPCLRGGFACSHSLPLFEFGADPALY